MAYQVPLYAPFPGCATEGKQVSLRWSAIPTGDRGPESLEHLREREELRALIATLDLGSALREVAPGHLVAEEALGEGGRQAAREEEVV